MPPPVDKRIDQLTPGPIHLYYQNIEQIDGGKNDKFVAMTNVGVWVMGYYDGSSQLVWQWAQALHARRQLLHGRVRRLVPQPPVARSARARPIVARCARLATRAGRRQWAPEAQARLADVGDGRPRAALRRPGHARRLRGQHVAAALPAERRAARLGRHARLRRSREAIRCRRRRRRPSATRSRAKGITWAWYGGAWNQALADGRRPADRQTRRHLHARTRQPQLPAAPPAVQLLRALRARHRPIAPST